MSFAVAAGQPATVAGDVAKFEEKVNRIRDMNSGPNRSTALRDADAQAKNLKAKVDAAHDAALSQRFAAAVSTLEFLAKKDEDEREAAQRAAARAGQTEPAAQRGGSGQAVSAQAQEADDMDYDLLQRRTGEIVGQMKEINQLSHEVHDQVMKDHEKLVRIDATIEDSKVEVQEGNRQLEEAEGNQKKACRLG